MKTMKTTLYLVLVLVWLPVPLVAGAQKKALVLSSVSPTSVAAGGGSFTLTATGSNFSSASIVQWNGASLTTKYTSTTHLSASVPSADIALAGTANITVYNPGKSGGTSQSVRVTITTPLAVSTSSVPSAIVGSTYGATLTATGGTGSYTWSPYPSGEALPPGVQLKSTGTLTGTPTAAGTYPLGVQVIDSANDKAKASYSMIVTTPLAVSTSSVPNATVGSAYSATLTATGGTGSYTWSPYPSGEALPPGVQLKSTGTLTGTPTTAGTYPFGVQVIDSANDEATQSYSMTVASSTVGCGAGTDNSQCGNVGNPYANYPGGTQPAANATLSACGALSVPSSGYVYRLTSNIGSDPTTSCLTWYYGYPFVLDLNGYTVTGMIAGQMNPYGYPS